MIRVKGTTQMGHIFGFDHGSFGAPLTQTHMQVAGVYLRISSWRLGSVVWCPGQNSSHMAGSSFLGVGTRLFAISKGNQNETHQFGGFLKKQTQDVFVGAPSTACQKTRVDGH